jgi:hypothetical protein
VALRRWFFCLGALAAFFVNIAQAGVEVPIYQAQVEVASVTAADRAEALGQAFKDMLVKVTGSPQVLTQASIQKQMSDVAHYVQQYSYRHVKGSKDYWLQVDFDPLNVTQLLQQAQLPSWGPDRPLVLMWVLIQRPGQALHWLGQGVDSSYALYRQLSERRGVPILFPTLDLETLETVDLQAVWHGNVRALRQAAQRYQANATMIVTIEEVAPQRWRSHWTLLMGQNRLHWNVDETRLSDLVAHGMNQLATTLASQFATTRLQDSASHEILMTIGGLDNLKLYHKALRYIQRLDDVTAVSVQAIHNDQVTLRLSIMGSDDRLLQMIAMDHHLKMSADFIDPNHYLFTWG